MAWHHPLAIEDYYFDAASEALIGADGGGDQPGGQCVALTYAGGTIPAACPHATTCTLCTYPSGAAGSGAGGAGAAGASSTTPPPSCPALWRSR